MQIIYKLILTLLLVQAVSASQIYPDTLIVAVNHFPPCVIADGVEFTGFDIDLWKAIAAEMDLNFVFQSIEFDSIFQVLQSGGADASMAGITINAERESIIDFSHRYLDSGLRIMVSSSNKLGLIGNISSFVTSGMLRGLLALLAFIFLCGQVMWWSERGKDAINDRYFPGIFEAFWLVVTTMTTVGYGDIAPRRWLGRIAAFLVMITGIGLFGWIIGEFAAATTIRKMESSISTPHDLRGKSVATVRSTTSVEVLKESGARVVEVNSADEAYEKLKRGDVDAVVYDAPALLYYASNEGVGQVVIAGEIFNQQYYGIAFPEGSPLREPVNRTLLKLMEAKGGISAYESIYRKWFGALSGMRK